MDRSKLIGACKSMVLSMSEDFEFDSFEYRMKKHPDDVLSGTGLAKFLKEEFSEEIGRILIFKDQRFKSCEFIEFDYKYGKDPRITYRFIKEDKGILYRCLVSLTFSCSDYFKLDQESELKEYEIPAKISDVQMFYPEYSMDIYQKMSKMFEELKSK